MCVGIGEGVLFSFIKTIIFLYFEKQIFIKVLVKLFITLPFYRKRVDCVLSIFIWKREGYWELGGLVEEFAH